MNAKMTLSFSVATFIAAVALMFFLSEVRGRLGEVERELAAVREAQPPPPESGNAATLQGGNESDGEVAPLDTKDPLVKLDWVVKKLEEVDENAYEYYNDIAQEQYQLKRDQGRLHGTVLRILRGLRSSGTFPGLEPDLPDKGAPVTTKMREKFKAEAEKFGLKVEDGLVTGRGLLNTSQDKAYPVEYFMTRFPDAGHETLVHLIGSARLEDFQAPPFPDLRGLPTALYKALLAAGFEEGASSRPDPAHEGDPRAPWLMPTGDTVYLYVEYEEDGERKRIRATDWMADPDTKESLPHDCFRFTGSHRVEDRNTGDDVLVAELGGFLASVFTRRPALLEVALESAMKNNYQYRWDRLPKHDGKTPLYVDLIFSKKPLTN